MFGHTDRNREEGSKINKHVLPLTLELSPIPLCSSNLKRMFFIDPISQGSTKTLLLLKLMVT